MRLQHLKRPGMSINAIHKVLARHKVGLYFLALCLCGR